MAPRRIYLDNAATSWPKPETVYAAVDRYQRELGAPAGRSGYGEALEVGQRVEAVRRDLGRFIGESDPRRIIFCSNGTDALNLVIHGLLQPGDHVVTTVVEHNSVLRPLRMWEESRDVRVTRVACDGVGLVSPDDIRAAITPQTTLIAITHASNVTGVIQPVAEVARIARNTGIPLLVDAAQTIGHLPIDVNELGIDLLASPGHKGLLGPLGTGFLFVNRGWEHRLASIRHGGTGTQSEDDHQPESLPAKYESGNLNVPGILGLGAAIGHLNEQGMPAIRQHGQQLTARLIDQLSQIRSLAIQGSPNATTRVGVVSVTLEGYDPQEVAAMLEGAYRVQIRPGLHCAPLMHASLGTLASGGTARLSIGNFNTEADIDTAAAALAEIAGASFTA